MNSMIFLNMPVHTSEFYAYCNRIHSGKMAFSQAFEDFMMQLNSETSAKFFIWSRDCQDGWISVPHDSYRLFA